MDGNIKSPAKIVIDASIVLAFLLPDERKDKIDKLFDDYKNSKVKIIAPSIIYFEVFNSMRSALLRKRISEKLAYRLLRKFLEMDIKIVDIDWLKTFKLTIEKKTSYYDAAYMALAEKEKMQLITLDKKLFIKAKFTS